MEKSLDQMRYEYALARVEELLPLVSDATPVNDPLAMELAKEVGVSPSLKWPGFCVPPWVLLRPCF